MKVAIVHYWLTEMRGGEKVVEALCELYPGADVFTNVYVPEAVSPTIRERRVRTTFIDRLPFARKKLEWYLPLMPIALEQLDLRGYDLVISIESGPAKGVNVPLGTAHICYCLSPMRYIWDMYPEYLANVGWLARVLMRPAAHYLRMWDVASAMRADHVAAISTHTQRRVARYWRRDATLIHPPVDVTDITPGDERGDFYLYVGQLTAYKRPDLAVRAASQLGRPLVVIGRGEEMARLRAIAGPTVRFLGWQSDAVLRDHVARCRALLFPGEEDFGIVPVECMAAGRPVIALGAGGALDTVVDGTTGVLFAEPTVESLVAAIARFETQEASFEPGRIRAHAERFGRARFQAEFRAMADKVLREHHR